MKNFFPPKNQNYTYLQTNRSDDLGSLWSTMGLDFQSNLGTIKLAPRLKINTSSADDADLGCAIGFVRFQSKIFTIAGTRVFVSSGATPDLTFAEDASTGAATDYTPDESDIIFFNSVLVTTTTDALLSLDAATGGTWTSRDTLNTGTPHMMTYFQKFNRLYYTNTSNDICSINTSWTVSDTSDYSIDLGGAGLIDFITCITSNSEYIWIGILQRTNLPTAKIYQWDGISSQVTKEFKIENAAGIMAITVMDDIPYAMDSNGILYKFVGYNFEEVGRLPYLSTLPKNINSLDNNRFIHPNGLMPTKNGTILALIDNELEDNGATILENLPSGIWEWSPEYGFTHKYSLTYNPVASATITDFGQNRLSRVGGLSDVNWASDSATRNGTILCGATYFTDATTTASAILLDDSNNTVQKKGYFVTTWFNSEEVEDKWIRLWAIYKRLLASTDTIVFKYRLNEENPVYATITWTSTTTFTTTTNITAYGPTAAGFNGTIGGEVEVLQGTGGSVCAHITSIVNNAGTYTVTIDTVATGVTNGTAKARFQKWIKIFPEISGQIKSWEQMSIGDNNTRIQIKCCMTFTGDDEFQRFALVSNEDIKINP